MNKARIKIILSSATIVTFIHEIATLKAAWNKLETLKNGVLTRRVGLLKSVEVFKVHYIQHCGSYQAIFCQKDAGMMKLSITDSNFFRSGFG